MSGLSISGVRLSGIRLLLPPAGSLGTWYKHLSYAENSRGIVAFTCLKQLINIHSADRQVKRNSIRPDKNEG